ncbi:hypothetical protein JTB14_026520 [Gonioctena quinquepunctata]|nr:hypothetical protein JTB14_026520 [Gonioctena quinquepunctata]
MQRHKEITLRKPQATSLSRATSFNRHNVFTFFKKYRTLQEKFKFLPDDIHNIDGSEITTVHNPTKVIAVKGIKQVGSMSFGERRTNTTIICYVNALGNPVPPAMVFARGHFEEDMLKDAPAGTLRMAHSSGW